jgi:hypothetical protein
MNINRQSLFGIILALSLAATVLAQPHISGNLSGTLGPGTYIVDGNCTIQAGSTLTIAAGTTFLHGGNYAWMVYGQFTAVGMATDSIYFLRQFATPESRWGGIRFQEGSSSNSSINYCVIDNCYYSTGGGLSIRSVALTVSNSRISNCTGTYPGGGGVYVNGANAIIDHCLIVGNNAPSGGNGGGVFFENCPAPQIKNSVVCYNTDTGS